MWSVGCIIAEMRLRTPLFPGTSVAHQVLVILRIHGYNVHCDLGFPISEQTRRFLDRRIGEHNNCFHNIFPRDTDGEFLELVSSLLKINPNLRPTAEEVLKSSSFLSEVHCSYQRCLKYCSEHAAKMLLHVESPSITLGELQRLIHQEIEERGITSSSKVSPLNQCTPALLELILNLMYREVCPGNEHKIPEIMSRYVGREQELMARISYFYGERSMEDWCRRAEHESQGVHIGCTVSDISNCSKVSKDTLDHGSHFSS